MRRLEEQTKHSLQMIRLSYVVIAVLFISSLIECGYSGTRGYFSTMSIIKMLVTAAILPVVIFLGFQYRKIILNERYLRTILGHMGEGVIVCNENEEIEFTNDVADKTFFRRAYKNVRNLYDNGAYTDEYGTPLSADERPVARALCGEQVHNQLVRVTQDGESTYVLVNAAPYRDNNGNIRGAVETFHDITSYKEVERENMNRQRAYRLLAENASDLIGTVDIHGNVLYASPSHKTVLGIDHNEYVGQSVLTYVHPDDLPRIQESLRRIPIDKKASHGEFRYLHADGHSVTVEVKAEPVLDQNGEVASLVIIARDITTKKRAQELLRGQNEILNLIVRGTPLEDVLTKIALRVDSHQSGNKCWIVITKPEYQLSIGPGLPEGYLDDMKPYLTREIMQRYLHESAVFTDIENDSKWKKVPHIYDVAMRNDLKSVWSKPLVLPSGEPIGVFGIYYAETNPPKGELELYDAYGQLAALAIEQRIQGDEIAFLAYHDPLTELPNRRVLESTFEDIRSSKGSGTKCAVMLLDIDRFKGINDTFGHSIGNQVVQIMATRLLKCIREGDLVTRWGGDEFAILLRNYEDIADALDIAERILQSVQEVVRIDDHEFYVTTSIGIAFYPEQSTDLRELLRFADGAMYETKAQGRNGISVYHPGINNRLHDTLTLERDIRKAIDNNEFELYYQPKLDIHTNQITGAEALIRWNHPKRGFVSPAEFIPVAEESGAIIPIGRWIIETVLKQLKTWEAEGGPMIPVALNVSAKQLVKSKFWEYVRDALKRFEVDSKWLELEITETAILSNEELASKTIEELSKLGVIMTLDDFGTGYSSLSFLTRFDIRTIKIDKSFITGACSDSKRRTIVTTLISLAHNLDLNVVAEGVETAEQLAFLRAHGCNEVQGYFYSKPVPIREFEEYCLHAKKRPTLV